MLRILSAIAIACAVAAPSFAAQYAGTVQMDPKKKMNNPATWCPNGVKFEVPDNFGSCAIATGSFLGMVLKSGTKYDVYLYVAPGDKICTTDGKDISHFVQCPGAPN